MKGEKGFMANKSVLDLQIKIDALESQLIFQEDIIESLNQTVSELQKEVSALTNKMNFILQKLSSVQLSNIASLDEETLPPHY